jgi:lipopolysaccharide transport protein LptA
MARSFRNACLVCLAAAAPYALGAEGDSEQLVFESQSWTLDGKTNLIHFVGPKITQGDLGIEAAEAIASGIEFEQQSEWRFTGNVRIQLKGALITADSAVFTFTDKRVARGELTGSATFEDTERVEGKSPIRGGANKVTYDDRARTLRLSENAWVHKDQYEMQGCDLIYNLNGEGVSSGSPNCPQPFRIRVLSQQGEKAAAADPPR